MSYDGSRPRGAARPLRCTGDGVDAIAERLRRTLDDVLDDPAVRGATTRRPARDPSRRTETQPR